MDQRRWKRSADGKKYQDSNESLSSGRGIRNVIDAQTKAGFIRGDNYVINFDLLRDHCFNPSADSQESSLKINPSICFGNVFKAISELQSEIQNLKANQESIKKRLEDIAGIVEASDEKIRKFSEKIALSDTTNEEFTQKIKAIENNLRCLRNSVLEDS